MNKSREKINFKINNLVKKSSKILFVNPFCCTYRGNLSGIAYLRGYLFKKSIKSSFIDFNRLFFEEKGLIEKFHEYLYSNLKKQGVELSEKNKRIDRLTHLLLVASELPKEKLFKITETKVFDNFFNCFFLNKKEYKFLAISVAYKTQFIFSVLLAEYMKRKKIKTKIIWGGSTVTYYHEQIIEFFSKNQIIDYFIIGEGEKSLKEILVDRKKSYIFNLIYLRENKYLYSIKHGFCQDINKMSIPFFEKNDKSCALRVTDKCYWGKCSFCRFDEFSSLEPQKVRSLDGVIRDIKNTNTRERRYYFSDSALPISFLKNFSEKIVREKLTAKEFSAYLRFEPSLTYNILKLAKDAGFGYHPNRRKGEFNLPRNNLLRFGLETTIPRLQKIVNKGIDFKIVKRILDDCNKLRICTLVYFILGLPTQTEKELHQELKNIYSLLNSYDNLLVVCDFFTLFEKTKFYNFANKYGIKIKDKKKVFLGGVPFDYTSTNYVHPSKARKIYKDFMNDIPLNKKKLYVRF